MAKRSLSLEFINKYAIKRLKYGIWGCFRSVEGAAKNLVLGKISSPPYSLCTPSPEQPC